MAIPCCCVTPTAIYRSSRLKLSWSEPPPLRPACPRKPTGKPDASPLVEPRWKERKGRFPRCGGGAGGSVSASAVQAAARHGLVIKSTEKDGPAEQAGLQENDLITKLDDQWLVNSQQFGVLVRMHKPGDEVTLTGLRGSAAHAQGQAYREGSRDL